MCKGPIMSLRHKKLKKRSCWFCLQSWGCSTFWIFTLIHSFSRSQLSIKPNQVCNLHPASSECRIGPTVRCVPSDVRNLVGLKCCSAAQIQNSILHQEVSELQSCLSRGRSHGVRVRTAGLGARKELPPLVPSLAHSPDSEEQVS